MKVRVGQIAAVLAVSGLVFAQGQKTPRGTVSASLGGKKVTIDYGRPTLKGRPLDELMKQLPDDRIWRAGENQVTTLTTEGPLVVGAKTIPAGKYSVYVHIPATGDWSLVLNSDPGIELIKIYAKAPPELANALWPRLDGYAKNIADKEVARVAMKAGAAGAPVDVFTVKLAEGKGAATLSMAWADKAYSTEIKPGK